MHKLVFLILAILCGVSCKTPKPKTNFNQEPSKLSFQYYNPEFRLSNFASSLRTDGLYFRLEGEDQFGDKYQILRFFDYGLVVLENVYNTPDEVINYEALSKGNIHGYYSIDNDSLFFTTKVYYNHNSKRYSAIVKKDSLVFSEFPDDVASPVFYFFEK